MKRCTCCHTIRGSGDDYAGSMVYPYVYGVVMNCRNCRSSYLLVLWELPDEMLEELDEEEHGEEAA